MDEFSLLASLLLIEAKDTNSRFRDYLCSLPRHVPLPYYLSADQVAASTHASDTKYLTGILSAGRVLIQTYTKTSKWLFDPHPGLFQPRPSFKQWQWAASIVMSRSWGVAVPNGTSLAFSGVSSMHILAPLADMVNHNESSRK